ncbi:glycosyltransferase family 2 protein [uncultured Tyzzerella sp.]|uniref:glycosyltransferase family 2 protein n=1 Tax=uncultured Tyzzerella sp. TaxID=2321398 RepID=UPI002942F954|nr:glycosyltransferase family 2 protein [uncultured Tyzzerella sp.]
MGNILLSICIPTYNRADTVYKSVKKYLEFIPENVEVVVSDNGSQDNTVELLKSINDKRFKLYKNRENKGFSYNLTKVIRVAKGDFALIMSDEDTIDDSMLEEVLITLSDKYVKDNISAVVFNSFIENNENFTKEDEFMNLIYGRVSYMSGILYNKLKMDSYDFEVLDTLYPHIFILLKLCTKGTIVYSKLKLVIQGEEDKFSNLLILNYIHPKNRLLQLNQDYGIILKIENIEARIKVFQIFKIKFLQATFIYDLICRKDNRNEKVNVNYYIQEFKLFFNKYLYNYFNNSEEFLDYTVNHINLVLDYRDKYDKLSYIKNIILFVNKEHSVDLIYGLMEYNFKLDYLCVYDNYERVFKIIENFKQNINVISVEDIDKIDDFVVVLSSNDINYKKNKKLFESLNKDIIIYEDLNIRF